MKRAALYSNSHRARAGGPAASNSQPLADDPESPPPTPAPTLRARIARWPLIGFLSRHERPLLIAAGGVFVLALMAVHARLTPLPHVLTQKEIDGAVLHTLANNTLPSAAAKAYEIIRHSVVRVREMDRDEAEAKDVVKGIGTGVVIVDTGVILTSLHVVADAKRVMVVFEDGTESEATIIGTQPENDLAVLQAKTLPDDLNPATLRSTADLAVGDEVVAVGFPFGIGPSATSGVVSGLRRAYHSPEGQRLLTNLIQFDAAVNPGNSGGPLVTADGEVVGIVTAILNPNQQRTFIGIGFAVPIENAASAVGLSPF